MKKTNLGLALVLGAAIGLGGCATTDTAPAASAPASTPAATAPAATPAPAAATQVPEAPATVVYFEFDSSTVSGPGRGVVEQHANYLGKNPNARVYLQGHADERGSREYNLALGERRAEAVERVLTLLGVGANRISTVSFGEERPVVEGEGESVWEQNRRVEFVYQ